MLQQYLPSRYALEGYEIAEEQSDDEVRTSQGIPERSEGKTKVIGQQSLPFTVLKLSAHSERSTRHDGVTTVLTVYGMRRRVRGQQRGAQRR